MITQHPGIPGSSSDGNLLKALQDGSSSLTVIAFNKPCVNTWLFLRSTI
jgi:hypothetical protein